ncbi:EamA family transporter RarD [Actinomadura litoris]|uniref:EamA family transporter RarD n=1 Tax=Actinomadura litoris TaxID=2678616 RepID=UPI001FA7759C|nr:EamA family transporter RarD [Actinomadura litoris]
MRGVKRGVLYGAGAYALWGLFPLYWPLLKPAGAAEILAHRIMWSLITVAAVLAVTRNWGWIRALRPRRLGLLTLAAVMISVNWGVFIYAVNSGRTIEAALGYFINPLISVVFGVVIFRERLRAWQWGAVGLGAAAVVLLTADYGEPPWIALILAFSFGVYGLLKKFANMPSAESLGVETAAMFVPALVLALALEGRGDAAFGHAGLGDAALLATTGLVTAFPLMMFNAAAIRLPLSMIGMLQYLAPALQFLIGLLVQGEEMPASRWTGFLLVWLALIVLTWDGLRTARRTARMPEPVSEAA